MVKVEDKDRVLPRVAAEAEADLAKEGAWAEELVKDWEGNVCAPIAAIGNRIREVCNVSI